MSYNMYMYMYTYVISLPSFNLVQDGFSLPVKP